MVDKYGSARGMGSHHYGGGDCDNDYACVSCQHSIENPSDIFGSCWTCAVGEDTCEWDCIYALDEDEGECPSWVQSTKKNMTKKEYEEHVK